MADTPTGMDADADADADRASDSRIERHVRIEAEVRGLSDEELLRGLDVARLRSRGHAAIALPGSSTRVFVKLLPLTALEQRPEHRHATANLFELPTCYQYRIGSGGFGAWRELEVHRMTNGWVLSGQCAGFPLLHGWRVLPIVRQGPDDKESMEHWGTDAAIRRRVTALAEAGSSIVLFLESLPRTLGDWLQGRLKDGRDPMAVVLDTEARLLDLLAFLNGRGVLHMDAHFENVLTDGGGLFLGDHGLAMARTFRLAADELEFFERHENFDRCTAITGLVHAVVTHYDARDDWRRTLRALIDGSHDESEDVPLAVRSYLARRGPVALAMGAFYGRLLGDLATEYPASDLQTLLGQ